MAIGERVGITHSAPHPLTSSREVCTALVDEKIKRGFAEELRMQPAEYLNSFQAAIEDAVRMSGGHPNQLLTLVETRIPFRRQLELSGIGLDQAVFYGVRLPGRNPYAVSLRVVCTQERPFAEGASYNVAARSLPDNLRPASPLEGINADVEQVLDQSFVVLPGGEYDMPGILTGGSTRFRILCLERYFGRPRISHIYLAERDALVGMLTAYK